MVLANPGPPGKWPLNGERCTRTANIKKKHFSSQNKAAISCPEIEIVIGPNDSITAHHRHITYIHTYIQLKFDSAALTKVESSDALQ